MILFIRKLYYFTFLPRETDKLNDIKFTDTISGCL